VDLSIVLGVIGIVVSIAVGWLTFVLTDRRTRSARWRHAKAIVLQDLSKALGEGEVPSRVVIEATIRSVLREQNASDLSSLTLDEVVDDLLRQVTSDPFLDAGRRSHLHEQLLSLTRESDLLPAGRVPLEISDHTPQMADASRTSAPVGFIAGLLASIATSVFLLAGVPQLIQVLERFVLEPGDPTPSFLFPFILTAPILFALFTAIYKILLERKQANQSKDPLERGGTEEDTRSTGRKE
jgi:hypothetical protein